MLKHVSRFLSRSDARHKHISDNSARTNTNYIQDLCPDFSLHHRVVLQARAAAPWFGAHGTDGPQECAIICHIVSDVCVCVLLYEYE